ncbi:MAG: DUF4263 domain-containing protein, partial [Nitrososphaera sp.]|nr:DUF4263 domain-containing protein [Nitrososphaera sp.]
ILEELLSTRHASISIEVSGEILKVRRYASEKYLTSGVGRETRSLCNPVSTSTDSGKHPVLAEFEDLISRNPKEIEIQRFIERYYRDIFGAKYDRIETEIWLRFPELDISNHNRRLDIFLRNSIAGDWDLFELKRIVPRLTSTYRDIPVLVHEIYGGIQQVRNYERILCQKTTKDKFKHEGIEYFEPSLHLVVGRTPEIPHHQWRTLVKQESAHVKLLTYDELLDEMRTRFQENLKGG